MARRSSGTLTRIPSQMLSAELRRREKGLRRLHRKRAKIAAALQRIEDEIHAHGGEISNGRGATGRRRPRNEMNLEEALARVLKGTTMSVTNVADAVQRAGYKTTSANFRTIVNQTLIKSDRFKKVGRGQYTAK